MTQVPFFDGRASFAQRWDDIARQANRVFDFGKFSHAALTSELEEAVKDYTGARFAVGMNSGTDALLVILRAIGVGEGDEVIVPAVATPSSASSVCHAGARPVFVDVQPGAYTIAPDAVRADLTDRSRAIMPVHLFTQMADMPALRTIAREAGVVLIEDSRQAIGMRHAGMHSGLLSTAGALSFSPRKTLGALGDAGMVITDDDNVADRCALLRHHGRTGEAADRASGVSSPAALVGINSKMDELQTAVLLARLPWLDAAIARRGELAACYTEHLAEMAEVTTPVILPWDDPTEQVWHAYVIEAERRDALASHLARAGIETEVPCPVALHLQPCFRYLKGRRGDHPVAEAVAERMLGLPLYPDLSFRDVEYVCHTVEQFYRRSRA